MYICVCVVYTCPYQWVNGGLTIHSHATKNETRTLSSLSHTHQTHTHSLSLTHIKRHTYQTHSLHPKHNTTDAVAPRLLPWGGPHHAG